MVRHVLKRGVPIALATFSPVVLVLHLVRFARLPLDAKLSFIPDDAFYYLELGREFERSHLWSFDRGRSTTSGFHVLFAYLCAFIERLGGGEDAAERRIILHAGLAVLATVGALVMLRRATGRHFGDGMPLAALLVGASGGIFMLPFQVMEWPLALLASAGVFFALATERTTLLVAALFVAPLCRTDLTLLGPCVALGAASVRGVRERTVRHWLASVLLASAAGACMVVVHTYFWTGELLQTSVRTKSHWAAVTAFDPWQGIEPTSYAFSPGFLLTRVLDCGPAVLVAPLGLVGVAWVFARKALRGQAPAAIVLRRAAVLSLFGYEGLYAAGGSAGACWYASTLVAPLFVTLAALAAALGTRLRTWSLAAAALLAVIGGWNARVPIWNNDGVGAKIRAFRAARGVPLAASWNAGRLGYLGGEHVINIDGLVNDDAVPYIVTGTIHCYLVHERIPFLADDPAWPTEERARYLGFPYRTLVDALSRVPFATPDFAVWKVDLERLARDPVCRTDRRTIRSQRARPATP